MQFFFSIVFKLRLGDCWWNMSQKQFGFMLKKIHIYQYKIWSVYIASSSYWFVVKGWGILSLKHVQISPASRVYALRLVSLAWIFRCHSFDRWSHILRWPHWGSLHSQLHEISNMTYAMSKYKWAPVSWSWVATFHLAACVCTSSNDKELLGADKACVLTHAYH